MESRITCIACPRGCRLTVSGDLDDLLIEGHMCKKGIEYGRQETVDPLRMLTTTVRTSHQIYRRLPVRLSEDIPLKRIKEYMNCINRISIDKSCKPGDLLVENILDSGIGLVATGELCFD